MIWSLYYFPSKKSQKGVVSARYARALCDHRKRFPPYAYNRLFGLLSFRKHQSVCRRAGAAGPLAVWESLTQPWGAGLSRRPSSLGLGDGQTLAHQTLFPQAVK